MCLCLFMSFRFLLIPLDTSACQSEVSTKNANVLTIITQSKLCVFYVNSIHVIFFNIMGIVRVSTACLSSYLRTRDHVIRQWIYHVTWVSNLSNTAELDKMLKTQYGIRRRQINFVLIFSHYKHRNIFMFLINYTANTEPLHYTHCLKWIGIQHQLPWSCVVLQCLYIVLYSVCNL